MDNSVAICIYAIMLQVELSIKGNWLNLLLCGTFVLWISTNPNALLIALDSADRIFITHVSGVRVCSRAVGWVGVLLLL